MKQKDKPKKTLKLETDWSGKATKKVDESRKKLEENEKQENTYDVSIVLECGLRFYFDVISSGKYTREIFQRNCEYQ